MEFRVGRPQRPHPSERVGHPQEEEDAALKGGAITREKRRELCKRAKAPDVHDFRAKNSLFALENTRGAGQNGSRFLLRASSSRRGE
jgi:hypothetical protein